MIIQSLGLSAILDPPILHLALIAFDSERSDSRQLKRDGQGVTIAGRRE